MLLFRPCTYKLEEVIKYTLKMVRIIWQFLSEKRDEVLNFRKEKIHIGIIQGSKY